MIITLHSYQVRSYVPIEKLLGFYLLVIFEILNNLLNVSINVCHNYVVKNATLTTCVQDITRLTTYLKISSR